MKRSACKGNLKLAEVQIPVNIYLSVDSLGIEGQQFHVDCGGKIRQSQFCEIHPDDETPTIFSGIDTPKGIVAISKEVRDGIFERNNEVFEVESSHKLTDIPELMIDSQFVPCGLYEMVPQVITSGAILSHQIVYKALLERLRIKRRFLLLKSPAGGVNRYCALLPAGKLLPLKYRQEVRQFESLGDIPASSRHINKALDQLIDALGTDLPSLDAQYMLDTFNRWLELQLKGENLIAAKTSGLVDAVMALMES